MTITTKRIYEPVDDDDGQRILVDRLWPRGVSRDDAKLDDWVKDIAPSAELRTWFGHDRTRWAGFITRYFDELDANPEPIATIRKHAKEGDVTLLYAASDTEHNNAVALLAYLEERSG